MPQAFADSYWVFTAERFGVGLVIGGILPTANALVRRLVPQTDRGTVYGITASAMFLGNSLGPLTGGAVAAMLGLRWVFLVTALVLLLNLVWVYYKVDDPTRADRRQLAWRFFCRALWNAQCSVHPSIAGESRHFLSTCPVVTCMLVPSARLAVPAW